MLLMSQTMVCAIRDLIYDYKHFMMEPMGNSEFCFPETLNIPQDEAKGKFEVEGKQN